MNKKRRSLLSIFPMLAPILFLVPVLAVTFAAFYFPMREARPSALYVHDKWLSAYYDGMTKYLLSVKLDDSELVINSDRREGRPFWDFSDSDIQVAFLPDWPRGITNYHIHQSGDKLQVFYYTVIITYKQEPLEIERLVVKDGQLVSEEKKTWPQGLYDSANPSSFGNQTYFILAQKGDFATGQAEHEETLRVDQDGFKLVDFKQAGDPLDVLFSVWSVSLTDEQWHTLMAKELGMNQTEIERLKPVILKLEEELKSVGIFLNPTDLSLDKDALTYSSRELAWRYDLATQEITRGSAKMLSEEVRSVDFAIALLPAFLQTTTAKVIVGIGAFFLIVQVLLWLLRLLPNRKANSAGYFERKGYVPTTGVIRMREVTGLTTDERTLVRYQIEVWYEGRPIDLPVNAVIEGTNFPAIGETLPIWYRPRGNRVAYRKPDEM